MKKLKKGLLDTSLFRRSYMICLFCWNISFIHIAAYIVTVPFLLWGLFLLFYNMKRFRTLRNTRYGFWLIAFVLSSVVTTILHLASSALADAQNLVMIFHVAICFFVFYSIHTEKELNFRRELYSVCRFIVYSTTVLGIIGLVFLMADIRFEVSGIKFIVFDNRFTGLFINPNQLGFTNVVAIFCSHMLVKKDFIAVSGRERVSNIWIGSCVAINAISLLLCDSNGAMILIVGYAIFFLIYKLFGAERHLSFGKIITKSAACLLAGVVIVASLFFIRNITQAGFSQLMSSSKPTVISVEGAPEFIAKDDKAIVTFGHENKNVDSGRFKLWKQAAKMFSEYPIMGIGKGNIYEYGNRMFEDGIAFSKSLGAFGPFFTDFHNGYITIVICSGLVGFALFCIFALRFFKHITVHVFRNGSLKESVLPCMYAFLLAYAVYSFIEVGLLYNINFMVIIFWLMLGYTSCFLVRFEPDEELGSFQLFGRKIPKNIL